jgi:2-amino-4-hydroxy-6-hydroxymethyldihydropteridine diphosphokinase
MEATRQEKEPDSRKKQTAYLLTGSNMGHREALLQAAREWIEKDCGQLIQVSGLYATAAWGKEDQPAFLNQAIHIETSLSARQLLRHILKIEKKLGRVREEKYGPRVIDIDILLYEDEIHNYPLLKLPHPELPNRRFALVPLNEIAAQKIHPVSGKTIAELLAICSDPLPVSKWDGQD